MKIKTKYRSYSAVIDTFDINPPTVLGFTSLLAAHTGPCSVATYTDD